MEGPPLGPGGEDITWPDQVAPRGRKTSSTRKIKPQTSNLSVEEVVTHPVRRKRGKEKDAGERIADEGEDQGPTHFDLWNQILNQDIEWTP